MKKLTLMTATAGVILALSACASTSTPEATTAAQETTAEETTAEETTESAEETTAEETTESAEETTAEETTESAEETTEEETTESAEETDAAAEGTTLTGTAKGFGGDVTVTLTMDGDKIVAASIEGKDETPAVGGAALETLEKQIVEAGSDEIDGVSGATLTSTGVKEAVKAALAK